MNFITRAKNFLVNLKLETAGTICLSGVQAVSIGLQDEIIVNGSFTTNTDWDFTGTASIGGGVLSLPATGDSSHPTIPISLVSGKTYRLQLDATVVATGNLHVIVYDGDAEYHLYDVTSTSSLDETFVAAHTGVYYFYLQSTSGDVAITVDNVSIRETFDSLDVAPTRSVINVTNTTSPAAEISMTLTGDTFAVGTMVCVNNISSSETYGRSYGLFMQGYYIHSGSSGMFIKKGENSWSIIGPIPEWVV